MSFRLYLYFERHPRVAAAFGVVFFGAFVAAFVVLLREASKAGLDLQGPVAAGVVAGVASLLTWYELRRSWSDRSKRSQVMWKRILIPWAVLVFVIYMISLAGFAGVEEGLSLHPLHATAITYSATLTVGFALVPFLGFENLPSERAHESDDEVTVMLVEDRSQDEYEPYFAAVCQCGWMGKVRDASDPSAESATFAEARTHGTNVPAEAFRPID